MPTSSQSRGPLLLAAGVIAYLVIVPAFLSDALVTRMYYLRQDAAGGVVLAVALLAAALLGARGSRRSLPLSPPGGLPVVLLALMLVLALWAGTYWIMLDYPLTRDEVMVGFDAAIFASGKFAQPLAEQWRVFRPALAPDFLMPIKDNVALVSNYMPGNALMRLGVERLGDAALLNPLLFAVGLVAMWDAARRLFVDCPAAVWVVLAGYVLSAQILTNAMTAYAMTGHLALNAVWLALFVRDKWWSHALAMAVGIWAMGLHQVVFHPLAVGTIILTLLAQGRWRLFAVYAIVYAAGLAGWMLYPGYVLGTVGAQAAAGGSEGLGDFIVQRVVPLLAAFNPYSLPLMMYNILRFFVWNAAFCLPLLLWAVPAMRRRELLPLGLAGSLLVTTLAVVALMAYQGHGWGYRYWHAVLPAILLLTGYGFREWVGHDPRLATNAVIGLGIVTLVLMPFLFLAAHRFVAPYDALTRLIERQTAEFVILETDPPGTAIDQIRNRADLSNRPLIFASTELDPAQVRELCRRGSVTFVRKRQFALVPFCISLVDGTKAYDSVERWLQGKPCWRAPVS